MVYIGGPPLGFCFYFMINGGGMHTPRLAIQGGRDRVAARELDEPSALRWTAGGKG